MTVITYRNGELAATVRSYRGDIIMAASWANIGRLPNGLLWAGTGCERRLARFAEWLEKPEGEPPTLAAIGKSKVWSTVVLVRERDLVQVYEDEHTVMLRPTPFLAFGLGVEAALAAMHMGANAIEACHIAGKVNAFCGGKVVSFKWGAHDGHAS